MALYKIETRKLYAGYAWANSWGVEAPDAATAEQAALALAAFERRFLYEEAKVESCKVSTWPNPGGQNFSIVNIGLFGERPLSVPEPAEMCLFVGIGAPLGHQGKKWFRMCLNETDVFQVAGKPTIAGGSDLPTIVADVALELKDELAVDNAVLIIGTNPLTARQSNNILQLDGIGFRDMDVGWYNRGP